MLATLKDYCLVPVANVTAQDVATAMMEKWIKDFGHPELLVTDQGSVFTADVITNLTALLGFKIHAFPAESQWRNGKVERVNRYIKERLKVWKKKDYRPWPKLLPFIEMSHHFTTMPQYGMSPYHILFGRPPPTPFYITNWGHGIVHSAAQVYVHCMHRNLEQIQARFNEIKRENIAKRLKRINKTRSAVEYKIGQSVMYFTKGTKDKLTYLWSDLATIVAKVDRNTYKVKTPNDTILTISTQRLRHCKPTDRDKNEVLGPLAEDYPSLVMEGDAKGDVHERDLQLLDREIIAGKTPEQPRDYKYIDEDGKTISKTAQSWALTYGQYVAYETPNGGWRVGQYLGDHPDVPRGSLKLRKMNVLNQRIIMEAPRRAVWRYEWKASRGPNVVAEQGRPPDKRPSAKNTGSLKQAWEIVKHDHIYCAVSLTSGRITSTSYRELLHHLMPSKIADIHLIRIYN